MARARPLGRSPVAGLVASVLLGAVLVAACGSADPAGQDRSAAASPTGTASGTASGTGAPSPASPSPGTEPLTPMPSSPATPGPGPSTPDTPLPTAVLPSPGVLTPRPTEGASMDPDLQAVVQAAIADLQGRVSSGDATVEVLVARPETFPDGSLGCPVDGAMVSQALVEGYRVVLRRADRVWLYTAPVDGEPQLCPSDDKDGGHGFVPPPGFDD